MTDKSPPPADADAKATVTAEVEARDLTLAELEAVNGGTLLTFMEYELARLAHTLTGSKHH